MTIPKHAKLVSSLKQWFAKLRNKVGDDGSHYPDCENIVQEFWDYSDADRKKATAISNEFLIRRKAELSQRGFIILRQRVNLDPQIQI